VTRLLKLAIGAGALVAAPFALSVPAANAAPTCFGQPATMVGTAGNNTMNGTAGVDVIMGMAGNDTINGLGGNDLLCGGKGTDTVNGGTGNDRLGGGPAADQLRGNENDDDLIGDGGNDVLDGGTHTSGHNAYDEAVYTTSPNPITANLTTGTATGQGTDTFIGVESLSGSAFADHLTGNSVSLNYLTGAGGSDTIDGEPVGSGFGGDDMVSGGAGNDTMRGGPNLSGPGDTVSFYSSPAGVVADLLSQTASGEGNDTIIGFESIYGSSHNDDLDGDLGNNTIFGFGGLDNVFGDGGSDNLNVLDGDTNDTVSGGTGTDTCSADAGDAVSECP
jgi:Ca2+-binding RTX toxin-like protein